MSLSTILRPLALVTALGAGLAAPAMAQTEQASVRLADVIRSQGSGTIDLMLATGNVPIGAAALEAFRQMHVDTSTGTARHYLALAIDVNENSKGLENSDAQGITLAQVTLTVTRSSGTRTYTDFRTRTRALVAESGSRTRSLRYTALGEAGSSRITGSGDIQSSFDSTLDIFVPDSLADATAATLSIRLLDVNKSMGEPEGFHDYSGGYEDLALINRTDARFLNVTLPQSARFRALAPAAEVVAGVVTTDTEAAPAPAPAPAPVATWSYLPSASGWYVVAYEDSYPNRGDYDFNDAVVAYRYRIRQDSEGRVDQIEAESYLLADGAQHILDWHFRLPVAATGGTATCTVWRRPDAASTGCAAQLSGGVFDATAYPGIDNAGTYFAGTNPWWVNTQGGGSFREGAYARMTLTLASPVPLSAIGTADPWLYVRDTRQSVTLSSRDSAGFPYAMMIPSGWKPPLERVDMGDAYPDFRTFVQSRGTQRPTWYLAPAAARVFNIGSTWQWTPR